MSKNLISRARGIAVKYLNAVFSINEQVSELTKFLENEAWQRAILEAPL